MKAEQHMELPQQSYDQGRIEVLKQTVSLSNGQLLELAYNEEKFANKLQELNHQGCDCLEKEMFHEAVVYFNEAEKILEYVASCGKTIQRNYIITTLNNQACLYQSVWELEKSASYIEAIIFNLSSFIQQPVEHSSNLADPNSEEYGEFSIYITRKYSLAKYYLQFCAVSSQNKRHDTAFEYAQKAIALLKNVCVEFQKYEEKLGIKDLESVFEWFPKQHEYVSTNSQVDKHLKEIKGLLVNYYTISKHPVVETEIVEELKPYSLGHLMQISYEELKKDNQRADLTEEISKLSKILKAVHISMAYFTLATELRYIAAEKHTLDDSERKNSAEFKESELYHLFSIRIAAKFIPCESVYLTHILNSFKIHYSVDLIAESIQLMENGQQCYLQKAKYQYSLTERQKNIQNSKGHLDKLEVEEKRVKSKSNKKPKQCEKERNYSVSKKRRPLKMKYSKSQMVLQTEETTKTSNHDLHRGSATKLTHAPNHSEERQRSLKNRVKSKSKSNKKYKVHKRTEELAKPRNSSTYYHDYQEEMRSKSKNARKSKRMFKKVEKMESDYGMGSNIKPKGAKISKRNSSLTKLGHESSKGHEQPTKGTNTRNKVSSIHMRQLKSPKRSESNIKKLSSKDKL